MATGADPDWPAIAGELAYALEVHLFGGQGEFADYSIQEANEFATDALKRYREAKEQDE